MCQVSTHPPRVFATNLTVLGKKISIKGTVTQKTCKKLENTIKLTSFLSVEAYKSHSSTFSIVKKYFSSLNAPQQHQRYD